MLRESSNLSNEAVALNDVTAGWSAGTTIAQAPLLVAFAEAVVSRDPERIGPAREAVRFALGSAALVDAAAIAAAFHGFTRIADATGIPYTTAANGTDVPDVREAAGVNAFFRIRTEAPA